MIGAALVLAGTMAAPGADGDAWLSIAPDGTARVTDEQAPGMPEVVVTRRSDTSLSVMVHATDWKLSLDRSGPAEFLVVGGPDASYAGAVGEPALPVVRRLIVAPDGAVGDLAIRASDETRIDLATIGFARDIWPVQPAVPMVPGAVEEAPFHYHRAAYADDQLRPVDRATLTRLGVVRGHRLFLLEVRPVAYNPSRAMLTMWRNIEVDVRFTGGDRSRQRALMAPLHDVLLNPPAEAASKGRGWGNYLIVTADAFTGSAPLTTFANAKTAQGFSVLTHTVVPGTPKEDIKAYIQSLWGTANAPDYLLLVGDVDTIPEWTGGGDRLAATDLPYGCMDGTGDWYPDMAIGRFSVQTITQLQDVVDKSLYIEGGVFTDPGFTQRAAFLAGHDVDSGDEAAHDWVIATYLEPQGFTCDKLYERTYGATTQDVTDSFNMGLLYCSFYGHAGPGPDDRRIWNNGPYFDFSNLYGLNEGALCAFLLHMTCNVGRYGLWDECFTEAWLRAPNRGAAVNIGPSEFIYSTGHGGESGWVETSDLQKFVFDSIYLDGIREAGPAWQAALMRLLAKFGAAHPPTRDYFEMFNVMGDPGFRIPEPSRNYLIVTPSGYAGSAPLNQFIDAKVAQGFNVSTYTVPAGTSNAGIKAYIQGLWGTPDAPQYVLLVGDTSGFTSTSNTIPHWIGAGSRSAVTDLPYACMDAGDDWYPDLYVGRFPAQTLQHLQSMVDKTLLVESGVFDDPEYIRRATFLASDDMDTDSENNHDWIIENYLEPAGYSSTKVYARLGGDTQDVTDAVNAGTLFTVYMGHSTSSGWWAPSFDRTDVRALTNDGLYGLAVGWSCNTANFETGECFGETWVREAGKGAAAYLSASDYVWWGSYEVWESSRRMERYFFESFFVDGLWRVAPAWQAALYRILADPDFGPSHDHTRNIFEEFVLLGDPALRLPQHQAGYTVTATPSSQSLCTTSDDEARYLVQVGAVGGVTGTVKLSASGGPTGTTIDFAIRSGNVPFTTVMTVQDLGGAAPGEYELQLSGNGPGGYQTTSASLHLADTGPGLVSLTSPPNGASDVSRQPTLTWEPSAGAGSYDVEVASDAAFTNVVFSAAVEDTTATVDVLLDGPTTYFWHVRANNGCGVSGFSPSFTFTTVDQVDYFTEQFLNDFDLDGLSVQFIPDGSGDFYDRCVSPITALPTDPADGQALALGEDGSAAVTVGGGEQVALYGTSYTTFYACDNGHVTFTGGDSTWEESLTQHFSMPRVAALFDDLSIAQGGTITRKQLADRVAITWLNVPEYGTGNSNTFQIELLFNGEIHLSWLGVDGNDGIVGLSAGNGVPEDPFSESDLSQAGACDQDPGFLLGVEPELLDVCAPDDAVFTIDVEQVLGFSEAVTLTVAGEPAGATVSFSANSVPPPFASVMTVGNTQSAAPGEYVIDITGTSASLVRSTSVGLGVATAAPPLVVLTSPADGASGVALTPTLTWEASSQALSYDIEVATDPAFSGIVYSTTISQTSTTTLDVPLDERTDYFWRVQAGNGCGTSGYAAAFGFTTLGTLAPVAYDMLNGETGTYTYFDDSYDGTGDNTTALAPLTGGLGDLTDGVIADKHWNATPGPYVGWQSIDPTITFHFDGTVGVDTVTLHVDDGGGGGGVNPPTDVTIVMGGQTRPLTVTDPPGDGPFAFPCTGLNLVGDTLELTLADYASSSYMMLSEVVFHGAPRTGACCIDETCFMMTEDECTAGEGTYHGNGTDCEPDPCIPYEPECLILSEIVQAAESGGCPRWIEITNTSLTDFAFLEGGLIVQTDESTDVVVDVDLSGITIPAGGSYVINSNQGGACTGAFASIYGFDADLDTEVAFGDGDDRYILTNADDGSSLLDIYGAFGVDGTGEAWEYTDSFAYRQSAFNGGSGQTFVPAEWYFGGAGALAGGGDPLQILLDNTTPGTHSFDEVCTTGPLPGDFNGDREVDAVDYAEFEACFTGPGGGPVVPECQPGDLDEDDDVDCDDWRLFTVAWTGSGLPPIHPTCPCTMAEAALPESPAVAKNRFISLVPGNLIQLTALRLTFTALPAPFDTVNGASMWIGPPQTWCENAGQAAPPAGGCAPAPGLAGRAFQAAGLQCEPHYAEWGGLGTVHVYDDFIVPGGIYDVEAIAYGCDTAVEANYAPPLPTTTSVWGDLVGNCAVNPCLPPDGLVGVTTDVTAILDKFKNLFGAPTKARCDLEPAALDLTINITDVTCALDAFRGFGYPYLPGPSPPPCP
jgi:hypothetical protein